MSVTDEIQELGRRWADAEQRGDSAALEALSSDDFTMVGPAGFVLDRAQWLERYGNGLETYSLIWDEVVVRDYGTSAVAIGVHTQEAGFHGRRVDGTFRATHIAVRRDDGGWALAGIHMSPIAGPPPAVG